jgi:hypothetical protein
MELLDLPCEILTYLYHFLTPKDALAFKKTCEAISRLSPPPYILLDIPNTFHSEFEFRVPKSRLEWYVKINLDRKNRVIFVTMSCDYDDETEVYDFFFEKWCPADRLCNQLDVFIITHEKNFYKKNRLNYQPCFSLSSYLREMKN